MELLFNGLRVSINDILEELRAHTLGLSSKAAALALQHKDEPMVQDYMREAFGDNWELWALVMTSEDTKKAVGEAIIVSRQCRRHYSWEWDHPRNHGPQTIVECVNGRDPMGLLAMGAPEDEYSTEIARIEGMVTEDMDESEVFGVVWEVFRTSFDPIEPSRARCRLVAREIFRLGKCHEWAAP